MTCSRGDCVSMLLLSCLALRSMETLVDVVRVTVASSWGAAGCQPDARQKRDTARTAHGTSTLQVVTMASLSVLLLPPPLLSMCVSLQEFSHSGCPTAALQRQNTLVRSEHSYHNTLNLIAHTNNDTSHNEGMRSFT